MDMNEPKSVSGVEKMVDELRRDRMISDLGKPRLKTIDHLIVAAMNTPLTLEQAKILYNMTGSVPQVEAAGRMMMTMDLGYERIKELLARGVRFPE